MERARVKDLLCKSVITRDGTVLGDVLDLEIDLSSWQVAWIFIALDRHVTDRFHVDAPFVIGTKAIALRPAHVATVSRDTVRLQSTLADVIIDAVVSFDTDRMRHIGEGVHR